MTITTTKKLAGVAAFASMALALAACGSAPTTDGTGSAAPEVESDFLPCLISDEGGWNDKSFNQSAKEGMDRALEELGIEGIELESTTPNDYAPNLDQLVSEGCSLIVAVGFNLAAATVESANANPELDYAIIDDFADTDFDGTTDAPNIKPLVFNTAEAAYLGGTTLRALSQAGRVSELREGSLSAASSAFATDMAPWLPHGF